MFDISTVLRADDAASHRTPAGVYHMLAAGGDAPEPSRVAHYEQDALVFDYFEPVVDAATRHEARRLHDEILRHVPRSAEVILDVGCGNAWVAGALLPERRAVISFDLAPRNAAEALSHYPAPNHFAVVGDAYALPFRDGSVDALISAEVMEHVPDVTAYLAELLRVTRGGGTIVISTPYDETIQYSLCIHCNRKTPLHAHLHSFNEGLIAKLLAGFGGIDYRTITLSNKALVQLRTHGALRHLPHGLWRRVDALANRVVKKPGRLVLVITKDR